MKNKTVKHSGKISKRTLSFVFILALVSAMGFIAKADNLPRGAQMPYVRYESESALIGGGAEILGPTYNVSSVAAEASDRKCVRLTQKGSYVRWIAVAEAKGLVLRFSIPDSAVGGGINRTLTMYINKTDTITLKLTSRYAWQYFNGNNEPSNTPSTGAPRMRFDEIRYILPDTLRVGDTLTIQKEANDTAEYYIVDFLELEAIPEAISKPEGYLSVLDYGAVPDDKTDDRAAFNSAISAARSGGTGVYVPPGKYYLSNVLNLSANTTIQGAGIWYSELYFMENTAGKGGVYGNGTNHISDLYLTSNNTSRQSYKGFQGYWGRKSTITNIWSEHFECGAWIADYSGANKMTDSLIISNSRFRNTYADGCNLAKGTKYTIVENCNFRNTGDDAMASWSSDKTVVDACTHNTFRYNTVENTYRAGGLGLFGGTGHSAHHCLIKDMLNDGGIRITSIFDAHEFSSGEYFDIHDMTLIRTGPTTEWGNIEGAINLQTRNFEVHHLKFKNIDIVDAVHRGIFIKGENSLKLYEIYFDSILISNAGDYGIYVNNSTLGWARKSHTTIEAAASGQIFDNAPFILGDLGIELLTITPSTGGSVTLDPEGGSYETGTLVTLTAVPAENYEFANWTGDVTGTTNPAEITMDNYKTVKANFTAKSAIPVVSTKPSAPVLSPNPVKTSLNIEFNEAKVNSVFVLDCTGKKVLEVSPEAASKNLTLDMGNLREGLYFINLVTGNQSLVYKIIKR